MKSTVTSDFFGIAQIADSGIEAIKTQSQNLSRNGQIPESR